MFGTVIGYKYFSSTYKGVESKKIALSVRTEDTGWTGDHAVTITGNLDKIEYIDGEKILNHLVAIDTNTYNGVEYIKQVVFIK